MPNIIGSKFGRWEVICRVAGSKWMCRCECGNTSRITHAALASGDSTQCLDCYRTRLPEGESAFNAVLNDYIQQARRRELFWGLSRDEARILFQASCRFCKRPPFQVKTIRSGQGSFTFNGIDRIDNSVGYVLRNCVPCCRTCNFMKSDMSLEDFTEHIERIAKGLGLCV